MFNILAIESVRWQRLAALLLLGPLLASCEPSTGNSGVSNLGVSDSAGGDMKFEQIPVQFIAALGDPEATSGDNAKDWGLWPVDPGPRGVRLNRYEQLEAENGVSPAGWQFDNTDWWLEENGLIMEQPQFPLAAGQYMVTGDREITTILTIYPSDENGNQRWELANNASLYDVTHLGCRSARYTPASGNASCSPAQAPQDAFRVAPGAAMPPVEGCEKQDYAVLFVIAKGVSQ